MRMCHLHTARFRRAINRQNAVIVSTHVSTAPTEADESAERSGRTVHRRNPDDNSGQCTHGCLPVCRIKAQTVWICPSIRSPSPACWLLQGREHEMSSSTKKPREEPRVAQCAIPCVMLERPVHIFGIPYGLRRRHGMELVLTAALDRLAMMRKTGRGEAACGRMSQTTCIWCQVSSMPLPNPLSLKRTTVCREISLYGSCSGCSSGKRDVSERHTC
jgi:hypothetical protein